MTQEAARGGIACPRCHHGITYITDKRSSKKRHAVRRRHECGKCEHRFTTYELITTGHDVDALQQRKEAMIRELRQMLRAMELSGGPERI